MLLMEPIVGGQVVIHCFGDVFFHPFAGGLFISGFQRLENSPVKAIVAGEPADGSFSGQENTTPKDFSENMKIGDNFDQFSVFGSGEDG